MLERLRGAGLIWPTAAALLALGVLLALGTWQLQRKAWKDDLIARIAARVHASPVELRPDISIFLLGDLQYLRVSAHGTFHHDKERYVYAPTPSGLGWHVYTPLEIGPGAFVWINRGFVPDARKSPASRSEGLVPGLVEVTGLIREMPTPGLFTPSNDVARNLWYWPDLVAMQQSAFPTGPGGPSYYPFTIDADAQPEPPGGLPKGGVTRLDLPNRHLEYAITWYGIALTLIGVYLAFAASRLSLFSGHR